ncbi:rRNA-binding ribosome biosynthesis protein utp25 [Puccinia graminis f. sp. tritici]|uniref:rRNA-binding ribosome biosynthesis protein utp25 n=1 Tax=Puccinia graminis f. sp. tritici TaxID=56615 RepID=A0A5B0Q5K2_PUCGR|nr:rRNA-binding ribosome biosynthesis protein utp25 [Puccinia graminis f. sp. tritici]KAA1138665.1 rRNA-binding ribosome biosynthesis protein utp25 [Puccinia graminis f. sp. tritici]
MFMSGGEPVTGPLEPARHYIWGPEVGRLKSQLSPTSALANTYPSPANQHPYTAYQSLSRLSSILYPLVNCLGTPYHYSRRSTDPLIINYHLGHWSGCLVFVSKLSSPTYSSAVECSRKVFSPEHSIKLTELVPSHHNSNRYPPSRILLSFSETIRSKSSQSDSYQVSLLKGAQTARVPGIQQTWRAFDFGPERLLEHQLLLGPLQQSALVKEGLAGILVSVVKEGLASDRSTI